LDAHESKLLLQQLFRRLSVTATEVETRDLLDYLGGYPPSIYLAARHAQTYGLPLLLSDKSVLVDFQVKRFTGLVTKLKLHDTQWMIMRYLCTEQVVPLTVLSLVVGLDPGELAPHLRSLMDQSLVVVVDSSYGLSSPIKSAIERVKGGLDKGTYQNICAKLTRTFWEGKDAAPSIQIVDATLHAAARADNVEIAPYADLLRVSTLHRLAREYYHMREWKKALGYVERAEEMDRSSRDIRELYFKVLVRLEEWLRAESKLAQIKDSGSGNYYYLKGFYHQKRGEYKLAIEAFTSAELIGGNSLALNRDFADCLFRDGQDKEALKRIEAARRRDPANIFILDLYIRICLANDSITEADRALEEMERYDVERKFYHHRKSRILAAKKQWVRALAEVDIALQSGKDVFEAYAQRIDLLVELERFEAAALELDQMKQKFGNVRKDVQFGLKCKLYIGQGDWRKAEAIWRELKDRDSEVHNAMLRQIFELKSKDVTLPLVERQRARDEAALLDPDLRNFEHLMSAAHEPEEM
jgi:tetratricopeptide (TPR) repeat protein